MLLYNKMNYIIIINQKYYATDQRSLWFYPALSSKKQGIMSMFFLTNRGMKNMKDMFENLCKQKLQSFPGISIMEIFKDV